MFVELVEMNVDNKLRKGKNDMRMLCVLLEIVQDLQCTLSISSSAAPLDDRTIAYGGKRTKVR